MFFTILHKANQVNNFVIHAQIKVADAEGKDVSLRNLLLNRCQKEFETQNEYEQALLEKQKQFKGLSVGRNFCKFVMLGNLSCFCMQLY